ncbi:MAG: DUF1257 domain-containing protein [bacterium]|jgi:hypothetical protein
MSGIFVVDTLLFETVFLIKALEELGCMILHEAKEIRGVAGCRENVEFAARVNSASPVDIGFRKRKDGSYEILADWMEAEKAGIEKEKFVNELTQKYAYLKAVDEAQKQGYSLVEEKNETDGSIRVVLRKYQ